VTLLGIDNHLPALQVVIPLMGAPLCFLLRRPALAWGFSVAISSATLIIAFLLLQTTLQTGPLSYALGGWAAPWGIEYRVDTLNGYILLLVTAISTLSLLYARTSFEHEINSAQLPLLYAGWLLCLTGFLGMTITGDAFNVFVFLEISSLSSYLLISLGPDRRSLTAAFRYLVIGTIGATFILIAIGLFYSMTGTLNMADLAILLSKNTESRTFHAAIGFLLIGLAIKAAIFPLHLWLPNAYTWAPSAVSVFLAATATKVAIYLLLRFLFTVIGAEHSFNLFTLNQALLPLGVLAVLIGSVVAIYQDNIKKLLAYSSVAQIGYMVLGITLVSLSGLTATLLHLFNHALMKGALFMAVGAIFYRTGSLRIADLTGLGRTMPLTMAAFLISGLSLIGLPLTVGFVSKWYLVMGAVEANQMWLAIIILLGSLLAIIYFWKVIEIAYFHHKSSEAPVVNEAPLSLLIPTWILVGANIYFGIDTRLTVGVAEKAALLLLGGAP